ncbi:MAG: linear amide C-N hydrolase [Methyloceanibacter sp.]|jgi:choloylglycine hydrolase
MFRQIGIATLIAAFTLGTTPAYACTGISLKANDGAAIRGRTLEFGFPMRSNVLVIPAGQEMSGTLPDGSKGLTYTTRYAIVGANALDLPVILDGLNDQGLSVGLFYFPDYAKYTEVTPENAKHAIAPQEFGVWVLANFATVDEVKRGLKDIVVVPTPAPGLGSPQGAVAGAHFFIQDRSGKSIAVEPVDGTLKVHDAPFGVMTNAPTYDWHMTNLQNYINLSVKDVASAKLGPLTLSAFGSGTGLHGMPGDFTPPSRFVRAAIYGQSAAPNATADEAVLAAFHILNQFDIPEGSVQNSAMGKPVDEVTEWTSVADLKNLRWYFRTREDQSIRMVDLKQAVDAAKGEVRIIQMEGSTEAIANTSTNFMAGK